MIGTSTKFKRRKTQLRQVHEHDRSGSKVPPEKRKAKNRATRKAAKTTARRAG